MMPPASDLGENAATASRRDAGTDATPFLSALGVRELLGLGTAGGHAEHILDLVPAGIFACDARGGFTFFNRRAADLWGREPRLHDPAEKFCAGQAFRSAEGVDFTEDSLPIAIAAREGRACRGLAVIVSRADGSHFDARLDIDPLWDASGAPCGAITVMQDVTETNRRERESAFLARVSELIAAAATEAEISETATRLVGEYFRADRCCFFEADEAAGEIVVRDAWRRPGLPSLAGTYRAADLIHPDAWRAIGAGPLAVGDVTVHPLSRAFVPALTAMGVRSFVACPCGLARRRRFVLGLTTEAPRLWSLGDLALLDHLVARVWPRVERARVEERLRAQERELRLISAAVPAVLSHWDREHRLIFASRAFAERWHKRPEDFLGRTVTEILGASAFEELRPYVDRVLAGETVSFEATVHYQHLGERYVQASYAPDIGEDGQVRGYLAAVIDMTDRRRAEIALFESEQRLRLATRTGKVGLWDWDIAHNRVTWTESLYEIHGVRPRDFSATAEGYMALVHPDDRAPVTRAVESALEHDTPFELELRAIRPSGGVIWLFTNATVMRENGRAVRLLGATLDITARKTAELALRESEARFRTLVSHAPVGIFLTDTNGDCLFVNETWRALSGLAPDQVRGKGWANALHPDDRERIFAEWYEAVRQHRPFASEYRFLRPDGSVVWLQGSAVESRNAGGAATGFLGTTVDITERKAAEVALRESERRFRTLASHAPVGIFLTNAAGETIFVNEAWTAIAGVSAEQARGRGWAAAVHPEDRERVVAEWDEALRGSQPSAAEYRFRHHDGTVTWVQGNAVPLRHADGGPGGYIGTIADITQRKALSDALEHKVAERTASLRDAIAQMEEFSYSVSHDLRAPLRAMHAYARMLTEDYGAHLDATAKNYLERIRRNAERMENLTRDVLTYSRVARTEVELTPLDLEPLLRDLIANSAELQPADVRIVTPLHRVRGHESSLGQCLANLLANAAKFVAPGVRPQITVRSEVRGEWVRVWVEDNGIGIEPQYQGALFRVFERVPTTHAYEGTGVGLAIVRKAVEKMGGRCGVESEGRSGSRFWVELGRP